MKKQKTMNVDHQPTLEERREAGIPDQAVCLRGSSLFKEFVYEWSQEGK